MASPDQKVLPGHETDKAIDVVRRFVAGKAGTADVKHAVSALNENQVLVVSIATRLSVERLKALRDQS